MTTPITCLDCGLPCATGKQNASTPGVCASYCRQGRAACQLRTIARMRPVVEAAVAWATTPFIDSLTLEPAEHALVDALEDAGFIPKLESGELGEAVSK